MNDFEDLADKTGFTLIDSPIWRIKVKEYSQSIVKECVDQLSDLKGYSGVGENGNPYDTESWNAALSAAQSLLLERFNLNKKS